MSPEFSGEQGVRKQDGITKTVTLTLLLCNITVTVFQ